MEVLDLKLRTSFYFCVSFPGGNALDGAFQEASGISKQMGIEEVVSGGENRFKYRLPSHTTYQNLILKRGIVPDYSPLFKWCQSTLDGGLGQQIQTKNIELSLLNDIGQTIMSWTFIKAYPVKWAISDLKSQESSLLIESIELAYQHFITHDDKRVLIKRRKNVNEYDYTGIAALFGDQ